MIGTERLLIKLCIGDASRDALAESDVSELVALACKLDVEAFLFDRLGSVVADFGPSARASFSTLRTRVAQNAVANIRADGELQEVLRHLARRGIDGMVLKGAAYRLRRIGLGGRFQSDVDLLVRCEDIEAAEAVLFGLGYRFAGSQQSRAAYRREHFHFPYRKGDIVIELHWDVARPSPPGFIDRLWHRSRVLRVGGKSWRIPARGDMALLACVHIARHAFVNSLRWFCDLRLQMPLSEDTYRGFVEEARRWPPRAAWTPLWILETWGAPTPPGAGHALSSGPLTRALLCRLIYAHTFGLRWRGLPLWLSATALEDWLMSDQSLPRVIARSLLRKVGDGGLGPSVRTPDLTDNAGHV